MTFERITSIAHPLYQKARALYKISFPYHEQREEKSQVSILSSPSYHFNVVLDNNKFIGEVLYWEIGNFLYIEHLCILPNMRNKHYGQEILSKLQTRPLILEIDPPIDEISKRRKGFYERCGFVSNQYKHIHPSYHKECSGHNLVVMSSPKPLAEEEYAIFKDELSSKVMNNAYC